jgi:hypothetical protein
VLQPLFGVWGLWASIHAFFIARGVIFSLAVRRQMPVLFPVG